MNPSKYRTTHQGVAAYFLTEGATLDEIGTDPQTNRAYFVFDVPVGIGRDTAKKYFDGQTAIDGYLYFNKLAELRSKLYIMRQGGK